MLRKAALTLAASAVAALGSAGVASAAVTFDPATGEGFVGKGDVQLALGLNNKQVQDQANSIATNDFTYNATRTTVTEVEWTCTNTNNQNEQPRERTTTTESSTTGVVAAVTRDSKKQVTGFILDGYKSSSSTSSSSTEGPRVNSCPTNWALTTPAGAPVTVSDETTGGLFVRGVALS